MIQHQLLAQAAAPQPTTGFDQFNPLIIGQSAKAGQFKTPGGVITEVLKYAFPLAGMILFVMILWGGFEMLAGATSSKGKDSGRLRITAAVVGFFLLFLAYWIMRLVGLVFGITIFT
jgi:hypothetical protein